MKLLVISNIHDKTRSENIRKQFASQSKKWDYEIVSAVMLESQPCRGISQSFKKCIEIGKNEFYPSIAIFEDDLDILSPTAIEDFINLWDRTHLKDSILLAGLYEGEVEEIEEGLAKVTGKVSGLHAMIIGEVNYDAVLEADEAMNLDYHLSMIANVPFYTVYPFSIIQRDDYSYNVKKVTDYNRGLRLKYKVLGNEVQNRTEGQM